jgi:hypothetical protein
MAESDGYDPAILQGNDWIRPLDVSGRGHRRNTSSRGITANISLQNIANSGETAPSTAHDLVPILSPTLENRIRPPSSRHSREQDDQRREIE